MPNIKEMLWTVVGVLVALALYDLVVRKALKISSYDEYENFDDYED